MSLTVILNGQETRTAAHTVAELLRELSLGERRVGVERNLAIVPKSAYPQETLENGDRLEIVQFVGGG